MKAIISHDVDHITVSEHFLGDTIIPKFMVRMHIELLNGKISLREYTLRWSEIFKNKWQNIDELITFNNIYSIPSTFFVATEKGVGLSYNNEHAVLWLQQMLYRGCDVGVHGIAFNELDKISDEKIKFKELTGLENFGMRMHYVRNSSHTFTMLDKAGYRFDSTEFAMKNPYRIGNMWEFPFQVMDGWVIEGKKKWQAFSFKQAQENTIRIIDEAEQKGLDYIGIDFHDRYFSHAFKTWLDWYMWLVDYLKGRKITFINFREAIKELEGGPTT
jgi:hypothetical protein